jgi:hypothetical protein
MQVNLFDTIQTSRKIVFVRLTAFVDNVLSLLIWTLNNEQRVVARPYLSSRTLDQLGCVRIHRAV